MCVNGDGCCDRFFKRGGDQKKGAKKPAKDQKTTKQNSGSQPQATTGNKPSSSPNKNSNAANPQKTTAGSAPTTGPAPTTRPAPSTRPAPTTGPSTKPSGPATHPKGAAVPGRSETPTQLEPPKRTETANSGSTLAPYESAREYQ